MPAGSKLATVPRANFQKAFLWSAAALAIILQSAFVARAAIYVTPMNAVPESGPIFYWGDGTHELGETWSVNVFNASGWVYGSGHGYGFNVDVYDAGHLNLSTVADASTFAYTNGVAHFNAGDTVFFRGTGGFYGAWVTTAVVPTGNPIGHPPYSVLYGTAYFQSDGSANFTAVPEPSVAALFTLAGFATFLIRRRRDAEV